MFIKKRCINWKAGFDAASRQEMNRKPNTWMAVRIDPVLLNFNRNIIISWEKQHLTTSNGVWQSSCRGSATGTCGRRPNRAWRPHPGDRSTWVDLYFRDPLPGWSWPDPDVPESPAPAILPPPLQHDLPSAGKQSTCLPIYLEWHLPTIS